jgi:hypothetical protein
MVMRRRIGSESQPIFSDRAIDVVVNDARLCPDNLAVRIELNQAIQVLRKIYDDCSVAALPSQTGSTASAGYRNPELSADCDCLDHIGFGTRNYYADRNLPIVGTISRVERPAAVIETDLAADGSP